MKTNTLTRIRPANQPHKKQSFTWQILKGVLRLGILVVLFIATYHITRLPVFTINEVMVDGGETISHTMVRDNVEAQLEGTYFRLIPKRFTYLYPHDKIVSAVEGVPRIRDVKVTTTGRHTINVSFKEYIPHALWCLSDSTSTPCLFMDENGYAFTEAPLLNGGTFLRHFVPTSTSLEIGQVIESELLSSINLFTDQVEEAIHFRIHSLTHMPDNDIAFHVNGGGQIFISTKKNLTETLENIAAVLDSDEFKHIEPGNFQYIDARFDNKIFINEELLTATTTVEELSE